MWRKSPRSVWLAISPKAPANSTPVGPPPTTTKVSQRLPRRRVGLPLGRLEREQHPPPNLRRVFHGFQAGRGGLPFVVAEVEVARAGRHDQRVVGQPGAVGEKHAACRGIHVDHFGQVNLHIVLAPEDAAQRRGDLAGRKAAGRDLVEERLKQMEVAPIYQRDLHRRVLQRLGGLDAAESRRR